MSNDKSYLLNRAKGAVLSRDFSLAARLYKTLLKSEPDNIELLSQLGSVYVREGNDQRALTAYQGVVAKDPGNFNALNSLGGIYRRLGRYEESIAVLETALSTGANENAVYYNMGHTYKLMGKYEDAADCFITVIDENPNDVLAYNHLGSIQAARGEHQKALQTYARALQLDRNHPILHYNSAKSYIALGKLHEAQAAYENALRSRPGWVEAMDDYAHLLIKMNRFTESQDVLLQAKKMDSKNIPITNSLGKVYEYLGKYEAAQNSFNEVLSEDAENYSAQLGLSSVLKKQKKYDEASDVLVRMEKNYADDSEVSLQYASVLVKMNKLADAVGRLNALYAQNPENPELLNLVSQYALLKDEEFRIKGFFAKIARVAPDYIDHFKDIAEVYFDKKEFDKAEKNIKTYLSRKSNDSQALLLLGKIYESLRQLRRALETYRKGLDQKDLNPLQSENLTLGRELQDSVQRVGEMLNEQPDNYSETDNETPCECECPEQKEEEDLSPENEESALANQGADQIVPFDENEVLEGLEEPLEFEALFEDDSLPSENDDDEVIDISELVSDDEPIDFDTINTLDDPFEEAGSKPNQYVPDEDPEFLDVEGQGYNFEEEDIADEDEKEELFAIEPVKEEQSAVPPPPPPQYPQYPQYPPFPGQPPAFPPPPPPPRAPAADLPAADLPVEPPLKKPLEEEKTAVEEPVLLDREQEEPLIEEPETETPVFDEPEVTEPENGESLPGEPAPPVEEEESYDEAVEEQLLPNAYLDEDGLDLPIDEDDFSEMEQYLPADTFPQIDDVDEAPISDEAIEFLEHDENAQVTPPADTEEKEIRPAQEGDASEITQKIAQKISNLESLCGNSEYIQYNDLSALLENLKDLCNYLPAEKKKEFLSSLDHLRIDFLLEKMSGSPGLLKTAQDLREVEGISDIDLDSIELDKETVQKTLEYLRELVKELPDEKNASIINSKIEEFLSLWK